MIVTHAIPAPCRTSRRAAGGASGGRLQRARGADEEMAVADGDDSGDVLFNAVDDAIVARSSMSSSVSRMLSKSATSMTTFEATPFCVMSGGQEAATPMRRLAKVSKNPCLPFAMAVWYNLGVLRVTA